MHRYWAIRRDGDPATDVFFQWRDSAYRETEARDGAWVVIPGPDHWSQLGPDPLFPGRVIK